MSGFFTIDFSDELSDIQPVPTPLPTAVQFGGPGYMEDWYDSTLAENSANDPRPEYSKCNHLLFPTMHDFPLMS